MRSTAKKPHKSNERISPRNILLKMELARLGNDLTMGIPHAMETAVSHIVLKVARRRNIFLPLGGH